MARSYQGKGHNTCWDPVRLHSQPGGLCESDWDLKSLRVCQHCYVHQRVWGHFQRTYVTNCTSMACQLNGQLSVSASQTVTPHDWMQASLPIRIDVHLCLSMLLLSSWHNRRLNVGWHSLRTSCDTGPPASCCFCCTFLSFPTSFRSDTGHRPLSLG